MTTFRVVVDEQVVAQSDATILLEGNRYFPADSIDADLLVHSWMKSLCYWKGVASYYTIVTESSTVRHAAWTYRHPSPLAHRIKNHVAFWPADVTIEEM